MASHDNGPPGASSSGRWSPWSERAPPSRRMVLIDAGELATMRDTVEQYRRLAESHVAIAERRAVLSRQIIDSLQRQVERLEERIDILNALRALQSRDR